MTLDHERLDVCRLALDFLVFAHQVLETLPRGRGHLSDQLTRASTSVVLRSAKNKRSHLPAFAQRSKRLNTVFHGPKSDGRSRHGTPVRRHHNTASTNLRSSCAGLPAPRSALRLQEKVDL